MVCRGQHKDPKRPKRPISAYGMYFADTMKSMLASQPNSSVTQLAPIVGRMWRALNGAQRRPYITRAARGMAKHRIRMGRYRKPSQERLCMMYGLKPKGFVNQYAFFVKDNFRVVMRLYPANSFVANSRAVARRWHLCSERQREPYLRMARIDGVRHGIEMQRYRDGKYTHPIYGKCSPCCTRSGRRRRF